MPAAAVGVGAAVFVHRLNTAVRTSSLLGTSRSTAGLNRGPLNFLLVGSNWRNWAASNGERADSLILLHVAKDMKHAYMVSVPRDLYHTIKPYRPTHFAGSTEKTDAR